MAIEFDVFHAHCNLSLGDVLMIDHPLLPPRLSGESKGNTTASLSSSGTTLTLTSSEILSAGDVLMIRQSTGTLQPEAVVVTGITGGTTVTVTRGQYNTKARAHASGSPMVLLKAKYIVMGIRPMLPDSPYVRVKAEEMPATYKQVGHVDGGSGSTGYATFDNGRTTNLDIYSNTSYAG